MSPAWVTAGVAEKDRPQPFCITPSRIDALRDQLQTKVRITSAGGRGKIEIEFYGPEDLHRITRAILEGAP